MKPESRTCDTCKSEIKDDLCRFFVLNDRDFNPRVVFSHWFAPCWNIEDFCKKYSNFEIIKTGCDVDEKIRDNPRFKKQLESDLALWL